MERCEVLGAEALAQRDGDGQRIAEREHRGGRSGGCEPQPTGFVWYRAVERDITRTSERGIEVAAEGNKRITDAFECGEQAQYLLGFTGGGEREHNVAPGEHAQIAVDGFGGMEKKRGRAGGGERGGDLLRDDAALAHAGDDDAAARLTAAKHQFDGGGEGRGHGAFEPRGEREETLRLGADEACGRGGGISWSGHDLFPASVRMTMAG